MKKLLAILCSFFAHLGLPADELPSSVFAHLDGDWGDADLSMVSIEKKPDGSIVVLAASTEVSEAMSLRIVILPKWEMWRPKELSIDLHLGAVRLESTGRPSEVFIRALAKAYGQEIGTVDFSSVQLAAISLEGDPRETEEQRVRLKIFFETESDETYAEAYLNFDVANKRVEFHEKDQAYRKQIIGFLSRGKTANQALQTTPVTHSEI